MAWATGPRDRKQREGKNEMKASHGSVVTFNYTLKDDEGQVLDSSEEPITYLHGYGEIIPGLEKALEGAQPGDHEEVVVEPADGYGERDPNAVLTVPAESIPEDVHLEPGMNVVGETETGIVRLTVREVRDDEVVVDANHPLAGKTLHFDVDVVDVHTASDKELAEAEASGDGESPSASDNGHSPSRSGDGQSPSG
jgi:FKBP-type peptidyl-prolyl cis-trans isomerase SlyD